MNKNTDASNNFPRKRGKPSESILILNVTNLPSLSGKIESVLLGLLGWNPWKDITFGSVSIPKSSVLQWDSSLPCLSHCRSGIASSKSQNSSVLLLFICKIKIQLHKTVMISFPLPVFFKLVCVTVTLCMKDSWDVVDNASVFNIEEKLKVAWCFG